MLNILIRFDFIYPQKECWKCNDSSFKYNNDHRQQAKLCARKGCTHEISCITTAWICTKNQGKPCRGTKDCQYLTNMEYIKPFELLFHWMTKVYPDFTYAIRGI